MKIPRAFTDQLRKLSQVNSTLMLDVSRAFDSLLQSHDRYENEGGEERQKEFNYHLKTLIRCFLGGVDATSFGLRQAVLECAKPMALTLEPSERKKLRKVRNPRGSLELGYKYLARLVGISLELDTDSEGWRAFDDIVEVRNGFTHPKEIRDLFAAKKLGSLQPALLWYPNQMLALLGAVNTAAGLDMAHQEVEDLEVAIQEMPLEIERVFDEEFFELVREDAGRSIEYLRVCFDLLDRETLAAMREAYVDSPHMLGESQYSFRNLVRTLFSNVEGFTNFTQRELQNGAARGELTVTGRDWSYMTKGSVEEKAAATAEVWSREVGYDKQPRTRGKAWMSVGVSRGIRNRITHPKKLADLRIDLGKAETILAACGWFTDEILDNISISGEKWAGKWQG